MRTIDVFSIVITKEFRTKCTVQNIFLVLVELVITGATKIKTRRFSAHRHRAALRANRVAISVALLRSTNIQNVSRSEIPRVKYAPNLGELFY